MSFSGAPAVAYCSFCLSMSGFKGFLGLCCRVLSVVLVCQFLASGDSGGSNCQVLSVLFVCQSESQGILRLLLWGIVCFFTCQFWASGDSGAPAVRHFKEMYFEGKEGNAISFH